jgi:hypothetical protein
MNTPRPPPKLFFEKIRPYYGGMRMVRPNKREGVVLWEKVEKVECIAETGGADVFSVEGLTKGKIYHPLGMAFKVWEDGSRELCYILEDDSGRVGLRATRNFRVIR